MTTASEKLKGLEANLTLNHSTDAERFVQADRIVRAALPQIVAVVEQAEFIEVLSPELRAALAALNAALS